MPSSVGIVVTPRASKRPARWTLAPDGVFELAADAVTADGGLPGDLLGPSYSLSVAYLFTAT